MKILLTIAITILSTAAIFAQSGDAKELRTVSSVDLDRYAGKWYEIAKYPNKFQKDCAANTMATYTVGEKNKITVLNECLKRDGSGKSAKGEARVKDKATNAKLEVRFAPKFLSFLSAVWGDYWIMELGPEYSYSVIGTPDRKYFWILSRKAEMNDATYQAILRRAEAQGFVPAKVVKTQQGAEAGKGIVLN